MFSLLIPTELTPRQQKILDFIRAETLSRGRPPSFREIGLRFGIRSPNGVQCHLKALEKKGVIERDRQLSRSIRILQPGSARGEIAALCAGRIHLAGPCELTADEANVLAVRLQTLAHEMRKAPAALTLAAGADEE